MSSCPDCLDRLQRTVMQWGKGSRLSFPWRRPGIRPYELVIAEVLLQQTRAEQVAKLFPNFIARCPDWLSLSRIPIADLEEMLRPLGLQRRRARVLHDLAGVIFKNGMPSSAEDLQQLPGIGQYIARAIAAQLFGEVVAPIDTNVSRALERIFGARPLSDIRYDPWLQKLALSLVPESDPGGYLVGLLDFARIVCKPRLPDCPVCPVISCGFRFKAFPSASEVNSSNSCLS